MQEKLLGFYNYTVILTYVGMLTGFLGIVCATEGNIYNSLICLMIAGLCDMFDGTIASTKIRSVDEKCFGIQIDSLSDLICFGILPSIIVLGVNKGSTLSYAVSSLYVLCALIRLAAYNVSEQNRQKKTTHIREIYYGLPVTTIAITLPALFLLCNKMSLHQPFFTNLLLTVSGILFLIPFRIFKPKILGKIILVLSGILSFGLLIIGMGDV